MTGIFPYAGFKQAALNSLISHHSRNVRLLNFRFGILPYCMAIKAEKITRFFNIMFLHVRRKIFKDYGITK